MQRIAGRKRSIERIGDIIVDLDGHIYTVIYEPKVSYPYHLVDLEDFEVVQSFDSLPGIEDVERNIGNGVHYIADHSLLQFRDWQVDVPS
ncbi:MAG: hypothetical protein ACRC5C_11720 [Bacilli bacterium]